MSDTVILTIGHDETLCFEVNSSSRNQTHNVYYDKDNGWYCTCEQYTFRKVYCKHMKQAQEFFKSFCSVMDDTTFADVMNKKK